MKVVMVGPFPEPGMGIAGGVERVIDTLIGELASRVEIALVVPGASFDGEHINRGVRTLYVKRSPGPGALRYWSIDAIKVTRAVLSLRPDIVHLQGEGGSALRLPVPAILTIHGIVELDLLNSPRALAWGPRVRTMTARMLRLVEQRARRRAGNVIVINPYVREVVPDIAGLRQFDIPNPIDSVFCSDPPVTDVSRPQHLLAVGNIGPRKNTLDIIRMAARLMRTNSAARLTLCGASADAAYHRACADLVTDEGLQDRIEMPGNITAGDLVKRLDEASCLVMASRQETAPMAIAEANARGVPVVAPMAFGIRHMVQPGRNGFFLPADGLDAQAGVLQAALDHGWDRAGIAAEARRTFSVEHVCERTLTAYKEILAARPAPRRKPLHERIAESG